jgi:hypothetical protein
LECVSRALATRSAAEPLDGRVSMSPRLLRKIDAAAAFSEALARAAEDVADPAAAALVQEKRLHGIGGQRGASPKPGTAQSRERVALYTSTGSLVDRKLNRHRDRSMRSVGNDLQVEAQARQRPAAVTARGYAVRPGISRNRGC